MIFALITLFFLVTLLVIYLLTVPPSRKTRSEYTLPPLKVRNLPYHPDPGLPSEVFYKPPEVIGTIDLGVKNKLTEKK